jgi:adenylate cyclase class IV
MKTIEIEFRARFGKKKYESLKRFLGARAKDLGEDDKDVHFFMFPDKLVKVVDNVSRKSAKIVLKLNKIGRGSDFEEIEIPVPRKDFGKAGRMFLGMFGAKNHMRSFQKRRNYLYKGVELALKWSKVWGYHLELEMVVDNIRKKAIAEKKIRTVAEELDVILMADGELKKFTGEAERKHGLG